MLRRAVSLSPAINVRLQRSGDHLRALIWLPFDIMVGRTLPAGAGGGPVAADFDHTVRAAELLERLDAAEGSQVGRGEELLARLTNRDTDWRAAAPPMARWRRVETVPGAVIRSLVASGAQALADAAEREGVAGAQPRAEVTDALLDSTVLTLTRDADASADGADDAAPVSAPLSAQVTLRMITAVTRMGFLPDDAQIAVDVCGRWTRVAAPFGSSYRERSSLGISLLT
ncbi:hypothetical protein SAMN05444157_3024 [Frankineae bacterium MT45]|nr:hypothetical protein SAMN05444157_3024 [Frankineae bacterium MT45]